MNGMSSMSTHDVIVVKVLSSLRIIRFHPLWSNSSNLVFRFSNPPLSFWDEQETFGVRCFTKEWARISWQKAGTILQVNWSSSPTLGKCTISEWQWYIATERLLDLCLMFYVNLVPGRVTSAPWCMSRKTFMESSMPIDWLVDCLEPSSRGTVKRELHGPPISLFLAWRLGSKCEVEIRGWCFEESSKFWGRLKWFK